MWHKSLAMRFSRWRKVQRLLHTKKTSSPTATAEFSVIFTNELKDLYAANEALFMVERLILLATTIEFDHPMAGKRVSWLCRIFQQVAWMKC